MNKNNILDAAKNNKDRGQEYENKESVRSSLLGAAIATIVGVVLFLVEYFLCDTINFGFLAVGMTAAGVQSLYEGIETKKLYLVIIGCTELLITIVLLLAFITQVVLK